MLVTSKTKVKNLSPFKCSHLVMSSVSASSQITRIRLPSPPSTFLLSTRSLQSITEPLLQYAVVLRILRYVSYHPWGSLRAQARRSRYALNQLVSQLWNPDLFQSSEDLMPTPFTAGAGVLWTPVVVDARQKGTNFLDIGGRIKRPKTADLGDGIIGWMATREPPLEKIDNHYGSRNHLNMDLSSILKPALEKWDEGKGGGSAVVEFLWDCRFLFQFDLAKMPHDIKYIVLNSQARSRRLAIRIWSRYIYPKIIIMPPREDCARRRSRRENLIHNKIETHKPSALYSFLQREEDESKPKQQWHGDPKIVNAPWIKSTAIRPIDHL